jgi:hypothetical protein
MSLHARRQLWIHHKVDQKRLHRVATQQGLSPSKLPHHDARRPRDAASQLTPDTANTGWYNDNLLTSIANQITLNKADKSFLDDATLAEVLNYLHHTYGPGFVKKMIEHLTPPRCREHPTRRQQPQSAAVSRWWVSGPRLQ